jgi:hypothetical protein
MIMFGNYNWIIRSISQVHTFIEHYNTVFKAAFKVLVPFLTMHRRVEFYLHKVVNVENSGATLHQKMKAQLSFCCVRLLKQLT